MVSMCLPVPRSFISSCVNGLVEQQFAGPADAIKAVAVCHATSGDIYDQCWIAVIEQAAQILTLPEDFSALCNAITRGGYEARCGTGGSAAIGIEDGSAGQPSGDANNPGHLVLSIDGMVERCIQEPELNQRRCLAELGRHINAQMAGTSTAGLVEACGSAPEDLLGHCVYGLVLDAFSSAADAGQAVAICEAAPEGAHDQCWIAVIQHGVKVSSFVPLSLTYLCEMVAEGALKDRCIAEMGPRGFPVPVPPMPEPQPTTTIVLP